MKKFIKPLFHFTLLIFLVSATTNSFSQNAPVAPVNPPSNGFYINGKLKADSADVGDWVDGTGTGGYVLQLAGAPPAWGAVNSTTTKFVRDDYDNAADRIFTGSSFGDNPNTWKWTTSKATAKCDINNAMFHSTTSTTQKWLILGGDRFAQTGTSYIDFQFSQGLFTRTATGFSSLSATGGSLASTNGRTVGDFVLSMEYTAGGAVATVHYYRWELSGSAYKFVEYPIPSVLGVASAFGASNTAATDVPYTAFGSTSYAPFAFVEAAVNIGAILTGSCQSVNIRSIFVSTKASDSYSAALKDFVDPQPVDFVFGNAGLSYNSPFCKSDANPSPTVPSSPSGTFAGSTGLHFVSSSTGVIDLAATDAGTYTATYTPTGGVCLTPATAVITVVANPAITPGTNPAVCRGTTSASLSYSGATGSPTKYSINFDATAEAAGFVDVTDANLPSSPISIVVPATAAAATYNGVLSVKTAGGCVSSNYNITVTVNANPTVGVNSPVKCANDAAVSITATPNPAAGGGISYSYAWTTRPAGVADPTNVPGFSASVGGTYGVVITNTGTGCTGSGSGVLTVNPNPTVTVNSPNKCSNDAAVTVTATPNPAVGAGVSYTYAWTVPPTAINPGNVASFSASVAGTYSVTITTGGSNCTGSGSGTLSVNENPPTPSVCVIQPSLCGPATGKVSFTDLGAGYLYSIKDGAAGQWHTCPVFLNVAAGDVTGLRVKSPAGCVSASANCNTICQSDPVACAGGDIVSRTAPQQKTIGEESQFKIKAYPNPFNDRVKFMVTSSVAGNGNLEVYNMMGQKVKTVYTGFIAAGTQTFELSLPTQQVANLVYVLRIGDKKVTGKILQVNK